MNGLKPNRQKLAMWKANNLPKIVKIYNQEIKWGKKYMLNVSKLQFICKLKFPLKLQKQGKATIFNSNEIIDGWRHWHKWIEYIQILFKKKANSNQLNSCEIPMKEDQLNRRRASGEKSASCVSFSEKKSFSFDMPFCQIKTTVWALWTTCGLKR